MGGIGQHSLFRPEGKLKDRVTIALIPLSEARHALEKYHYLHRTRTGRQLNYSVSIDGVIDGVITFAYPMMSAELCGVPSDELLEFARLYLHSNIPHTASCAIGKTLKRVREDWKNAFPDAKPIKLIVSWSDTELHSGTVYKASNFKWLRKSIGAPHGNASTSKRGARVKHGDYKHDKDCWVYTFKR